MNAHNDTELKQILKNWAAHEPLPAMGRARLLQAAAIRPSQTSRTRQFHFSEIPNGLFTWAMVYNMDGRMSALRLIS